MATEYYSYKTELDLNNKQRTLCARSAGVARFAYNFGLARRNEYYQEHGKGLNIFAIKKELNALKKTEYTWIQKVSCCCANEGLRDLDQAFRNYFIAIKEGRGKAEHPRFKKKKIGEGSFRLEGAIYVGEDWIQVPKLGRLRLKQRGYFPTDEKILHVTISETAGRWFCSIKIRREVPQPTPSSETQVVGVDVGFRNVAVLSDGTVHPNHKFYNQQLKKLRALNKDVARKQKGSQNWKKAMHRLRQHHYRIACARNDQMHKITTDLVRRFGTIVIETLNVKGMHQNKRLSKTAHDTSLYEFRRQVEYKAERSGVVVVKADMFYPSSQLCSACGKQHKNLSLRDSIFVCPACGFTLDRDLNAARNLKALAAGAAVITCGVMVSPEPVLAHGDEAGSQLGTTDQSGSTTGGLVSPLKHSDVVGISPWLYNETTF